MKRCAGIVLVLVFFGFGCGDGSNTPTSPTTTVCSYTFTPSKVVASSLSQTIIVQIKTGPDCPWVATTTDSWINITYQGSDGTGDLIFNLERNQCTSRARTGFFYINGSENFLEVIQDGSDLGLCP